MKTTNTQKSLKILIVNYEFPPLGGGGGVAAYDLAREWAKKGDVDVLTSSFKGLPRYECMDNIHVYRTKIFFRKSRDAASLLSLLSYVITGFFKGIALARKNRYDVINTHFAVPSGPLGYALAKIFRIKNVLSLHGGDIYDPSKKLSPHRNPLFKRVVRFVLNRADRIIAQSSNTKENACTYYNPKKNIDIIPLAFHEPPLRSVSRKQYNFSSKDFLLISIGRIVKRKALDVAIKALAEIKDIKVKLIIIGDGPEKENLERLVSELHLKGRVFFPGFVAEEEKYNYLQLSDLFVLTSLHEGFGIVFMEAMYCGLPIVCTNHGGQVDFLEHEKNALLINTGDVAACKESITRFYTDKKLYSTCSKNNKKKVTQFYADNIAAQYEQIFRNVSFRSEG